MSIVHFSDKHTHTHTHKRKTLVFPDLYYQHVDDFLLSIKIQNN